MNKLNNKQIIVVAICVIAFLALLCRSDNSFAPIITEQNSTTTGAAVDNLSTTEPTNTVEHTQPDINASNNLPFDLSDIPSYSGSPYYEVNNNQPFFQADELTTVSFLRFSELDSLGRCGVAYACIGTDSLPNEERGAIGMIKPSCCRLKTASAAPLRVTISTLCIESHLFLTETTLLRQGF